MKLHPFSAALLPALLLGAVTAAGATDIYKYQLPDGSILYTQERARNADLVSVLKLPAPTAAEKAARRAADRQLQQQIARADRLDARRDDPAAGVDVLVAAPVYPGVPTGMAPLPGERQPIAGGGSRLNDAYWARMQALGIQPDEATAEETSGSGMLFAK